MAHPDLIRARLSGSIPSVGGSRFDSTFRVASPEEGDQLGSSRITACVALAATALVAVGCGGGDNDTTTQATVTKSEYVHSVKARCAAYSKERHAAEKPLQQLFQGFQDPSQIPPERLKAASDQLAALNDTTRQVLTDLKNLPRPEADRAKLDQVFANYDDAQAALNEADRPPPTGTGPRLPRRSRSSTPRSTAIGRSLTSSASAPAAETLRHRVPCFFVRRNSGSACPCIICLVRFLWAARD